MLILGAHESIAGGFHKAVERIQTAGGQALQIFVKPNRNWSIPPLSADHIARFRAAADEAGLQALVGHSSYLLNLASPKEPLWEKSKQTLIQELQRSEQLGLSGLVLHPGAHTGSGEEAGLARIAQALGEVHAATPGLHAQVLLETTAGQGTTLGARFEHLAWLIEHTPQGHRLGVCLDTCHIFAAGYELRTASGYQSTMDEFEHLIGLERLKALHLNDCKAPLGSHKDRHDHIGAGHIGRAGFRQLMNDPRLDGLPGLLETPKGKDLAEDKENLKTLRGLVNSSEPVE